LPRKVASTA